MIFFPTLPYHSQDLTTHHTSPFMGTHHSLYLITHRTSPPIGPNLSWSKQITLKDAVLFMPAVQHISNTDVLVANTND